MTVAWTARALLHLRHLRRYLERDSPQNADLVAERILPTVDRLAEQPQMGRPGRLVGTRELVVPNTSFILPYRVKNDRLELLAVLRARQKWPPKL